MMEMAVGPGGTAPRAAVPGYRVAGKTGTAHKAEAGGYAENKYVSSFVGFGPVSNPRFIVAVMLDEPVAAAKLLRGRRERAGVLLRDGRGAAHAVGAAGRAADPQRPGARAAGRRRGARAGAAGGEG